MDPYIRPHDALFDMTSMGTQTSLNRKLMIAPLAFMHGRTMNDTFVILDEAQKYHP